MREKSELDCDPSKSPAGRFGIVNKSTRQVSKSRHLSSGFACPSHAENEFGGSHLSEAVPLRAAEAHTSAFRLIIFSIA